MKAFLGNSNLNDLLSKRIGTGKCVLLRYGPGSGGDLVLKQLFHDRKRDTFSVYVSTHESIEDVRRDFKKIEVESEPEIVTLLPLVNDGLEKVKKRDRFRSEGIMATDLMELPSASEAPSGRNDPSQRMLSTLTSLSQKQVLPFRLVLDSLVDLIGSTSMEEVHQRVLILKQALREKGGIAVLGAPLDWDGLKGTEGTLFDALLEARCENKGGSWTRTFTIRSIKGDELLPEEQELRFRSDIPKAISLD